MRNRTGEKDPDTRQVIHRFSPPEQQEQQQQEDTSEAGFALVSNSFAHLSRASCRRISRLRPRSPKLRYIFILFLATQGWFGLRGPSEGRDYVRSLYHT